MKLVNFKFVFTLFFFYTYNEHKFSVLGKHLMHYHTDNANNSSGFLEEFNSFSDNITALQTDLTKLYNITNTNNSLIEPISKNIVDHIKAISVFHGVVKKKIRGLETHQAHKNLKRRKSLDDDNTVLFYNSLSLVMLSMLAGGLVGVVFILYFTFRKEDS